MKRKIILASGSSQRKKLLETIGLDFEIEKSDFKEDMAEKLSANKLARKLALGKAQDVAKKHKNAIIIGVDTFAIIGKEFLGSPRSNQEAKKMIKKISGKKHKIITGLAIIDTGINKTITDYDIIDVWFKKLTHKEIDHYIKLDKSLNKAAGYSIQETGSLFIEKINGNYASVVGLPINKIYKHLLKLGVNILA